MGIQTDPSKLNFNGGEYATFTDANGNTRTVNEQGRETWQSEYDNNVRETREREEAQRQGAAEAEKIQQAEERKRNQEEEKRRREAQQNSRSSTASSGSSMAGFFLGTAGLALPFIFNGVLVLILAVLGKIFAPVMPLVELLWELFWMFLDCWFRVFSKWFSGELYKTFFRNLMSRWVFPVEMAIAAIFLIGTLIKCFSSNDYWYEDNKNMKPLIIFPVLELLHSLTAGSDRYYSFGPLKSIANGLFLGMWVMIVMGWIIRLVDRIKYR